MNVSQRLARLHNQKSLPTADSTTDELQQRLQRLQLKGCRSSQGADGPLPPLSEQQLADELNGRLIAPGLILVEERLPLATRHGQFQIGTLHEEVMDLPGVAPIDVGNLLFMDTETTGLSGGSGTLAFMLGLGRIEAGALQIRQYLLTSFAGERAMLEDCAAWLNGDEQLVTYNGKSFDLPLLTTRSRMASASDSFTSLDHLDLLHPLRRLYKGCWPDCRLASAEERLIGFQRVNDLSGADAPEAWLEWIRRGDHSRLGGVLKHNRWDLISLALLLPLLARAYRDPGSWGGDRYSAAHAWNGAGQETLALQLLETDRRRLCDRGLAELALIWRRRGNWAKACALWSQLSARGNSDAIEALAKYHEHVARDLSTAYRLSARLPEGHARRQRRRRLAEKIDRRQLTMELFSSSSL